MEKQVTKKELTQKEKWICAGFSFVSGALSVWAFIQLRNTMYAVLNLLGIRFLAWQAVVIASVIIGGMACFAFLIAVYELFQLAFRQGKGKRQILRIHVILITILFLEYLLKALGARMPLTFWNLLLLSGLGVLMAAGTAGLIKKQFMKG